MSSREDDVARIEAALREADAILADYRPGEVEAEWKSAGDPVTVFDRRVNEALHRLLPQEGEGWLSEETADDLGRLEKRRVWVVDPLDGTREFVAGIPEWCVSIGLVEDGAPVAGGICNPLAGETIVGAVGAGVRRNGALARATGRAGLAGALVLASRSECGRGEWKRFEGAAFEVLPMGSVAYKLGRVAAGLADATWTLVPKHEWDVAAGVALVRAAGGVAAEWPVDRGGFNRRDPLLTGFVATAPGLAEPVRALLAPLAPTGR